MAKDTTRQQQVALMKDKLMTQLGKSGVVLLKGIISQEEYNRDLSGNKGLKIWNEMRRSDGTVRAALMVLKLPILAAGAHIEAASDDPRDQLAAQIVEYSLFECISFDDTVRQALTLLDFGFSLFEQTYTVDTFEGREYILLGSLGFRKQQSIEKWVTKEDEPGVTQAVAGGDKVSIDDIKLTRFTHDQEGDNFEGTSVLRAAYKHWYMKDTLYQVDAIRHEKQGLGILKIKTPSTAKEEDKKTAREIAREQRANEEAYVEELEGFSFEFMDMKAHTVTDIMPSVQHHDRQILKSVLAQFLDIGSQDSSGSYAASNDQADIFIMALESVSKLIADRINKTVISNILELNGLGDRDEKPKLVFNRIGRESIQVFSEALNKLFVSGALTPDPEVENYIREFLHLPAMSEEMVARYDEVRAVRKNPSAANPTGPAQPNIEDEPVEAHELLSAAKAMREKLKGYAGDANK